MNTESIQSLTENESQSEVEEENLNEYEKIIRKLEADIRNHIRVQYQMKLVNEELETRLNRWAEQGQEKCKCEESRKRENEILILRAENANLKSTIKNMEEKYRQSRELDTNIAVIKDSFEKELQEKNILISCLKDRLREEKMRNFKSVKKSSSVVVDSKQNSVKKVLNGENCEQRSPSPKKESRRSVGNTHRDHKRDLSDDTTNKFKPRTNLAKTSLPSGVSYSKMKFPTKLVQRCLKNEKINSYSHVLSVSAKSTQDKGKTNARLKK